eukprot:TRINITY_DN820_c0_g1_i1.p1 TRINITY_DN820_c0_g1~~TRINITY_DN820_c0_g1_i1.p1  ORF type:complete len:163 (+),score=42.21 TRINITY_DN820_c0_g1_i1:325-813(+)
MTPVVPNVRREYQTPVDTARMEIMSLSPGLEGSDVSQDLEIEHLELGNSLLPFRSVSVNPTRSLAPIVLDDGSEPTETRTSVCSSELGLFAVSPPPTAEQDIDRTKRREMVLHPSFLDRSVPSKDLKHSLKNKKAISSFHLSLEDFPVGYHTYEQTTKEDMY